MRRFIEGVDRGQTTLFPECLEDGAGMLTAGATVIIATVMIHDRLQSLKNGRSNRF